MWSNRTTLAGSYSRELCKAWASCPLKVAPPGAFGPPGLARQAFLEALRELVPSTALRLRADVEPEVNQAHPETSGFEIGIRYLAEHPTVFGGSRGQQGGSAQAEGSGKASG